MLNYIYKEMGNYEELKKAIKALIKPNGMQEITGSVMQNALITIISAVGKECAFAGVAKTTTTPNTPDGNVFYLASETGKYPNFNNVYNSGGLIVLYNKRGFWEKEEIGAATIENTGLSCRTLYLAQGAYRVEGDIRNENTGGNLNVRLKTPAFKTQNVNINIPKGFQMLVSYADDSYVIVKNTNFAGGLQKILTDYPYCRLLIRKQDSSNITNKDVVLSVSNAQTGELAQTTGDRTDIPMSQDAVTKALGSGAKNTEYLINEFNVSVLPISQKQNEVLTKEQAIQRLNDYIKKINKPQYGAVVGLKCTYYDGLLIHTLVYKSGGMGDPVNWEDLYTERPFPFKTSATFVKLTKMRYAIKEIYCKEKKYDNLKIMVFRNSGANGAKNTRFVIGTGTGISDLYFVADVNLGSEPAKGVKKHEINGFIIIIDWDLVDFNYDSMYDDDYILSDEIYSYYANPVIYAEHLLTLVPGNEKPYISVDASGKGDYISLQDAINNAKDTKESPKTIVVFPGVYEMPAYDSASRPKGGNRHLSIIGTDKVNCIIRNDVGYYTTVPYVDNSPLKLAGNCYLANLTIISTDTNYPPSGEIDRHKAYCIHADFPTESGDIFEINNCRFVNNHFSCIGFGIRAGYTLKVVNCELTTTMHVNNKGYGALYGHDSTGDGVAYLYVYNCVIDNKSKSAAVAVLNAYNRKINLRFVGNVCTNAGGKLLEMDSTYHTIEKLSFGNNVDEMNYKEV